MLTVGTTVTVASAVSETQAHILTVARLLPELKTRLTEFEKEAERQYV